MSLKNLPILLAVLSLNFACNQQTEKAEPEAATLTSPEEERQQINSFLDQWHDDAANARPAYFDKIADKGIYIGTDKTELWDKDEFQEWSKKYFDQGKGWDFDAMERNIYFSEDGRIAWFDELLDTWMGDCRASGVLSRTGDNWKIEHYHLAVSVPNDTLDSVIELIKVYEQKHSDSTG